jgi:hypothetical protein
VCRVYKGNESEKNLSNELETVVCVLMSDGFRGSKQFSCTVTAQDGVMRKNYPTSSTLNSS